MSYTDASDNATDIQDAVNNRIMPPWPPDPDYNHFAHERVLSQQEIDDISDWVNNGMDRGDSTTEPAPPVFNGISEIPNPDAILGAPVYNVNTTTDLYRCFVIPAGNSIDKYITGIEAIPGNRAVVHHILIYSDTSSVPAQLDAADPDPGYTNFGGTGSQTSKLIGIWVPGQSAYYTPPGMGIKLPANTNVILQIHYPGGISGQVDSTKIALKYSTTTLREIAIESPLNHYQLDNGPLVIPPNQVKTFTAHYVLPIAVSTLAVGPHMHLLGKSIQSYAVTPTSDTIPFIDIPNWDFHWQGVYSFPRVIKVPTNSVLYSSATYDNTANNPENPNDPPAWVTLGESTTDEMMLVYFAYTYYFPGDENIIIDSNVVTDIAQPVTSSIITTAQLYDPVPNPTSERVTIQYFLPHQQSFALQVFDLTGKLIREVKGEEQSGLITSQFDLHEIAAGQYIIKLTTAEISRSKKLIKE